jgi:transposase
MKTTSNTTNNPAFFLGIDVGKTDLFCHVIHLSDSYSERFDNTEPGLIKLIAWLSNVANPGETIACLEQTGHYAKPIAKTLSTLGLAGLHVVNPRCIKAFASRKLRRNKSDSADARLIAEFARAEHLELRQWIPQTPENEQLTEFSRYAESLTSDNARLKTKCEAVTNPAILRSLKRRIKSQEKEIADLRRRINALIRKQPAIRKQMELLSSIPGVGEITCHILIAELPEIDLFEDARQLAAWAGVTPRHYVSGTSGRTSTPITKVGSANLRRALFMPAMTARTNNPLLKTFGDRLKKNGKKPKQVIIAIMRKLLHQIYGILSSGQPFNPEKRGFQPA